MTPALDLLDRAMPALWRATWQATLLIGLVFAARWLLGRRLAPSWRFALWGVVLARLLLPVLPGSPVSLFRLAGALVAPREDAKAGPVPPSMLALAPAPAGEAPAFEEPLPGLVGAGLPETPPRGRTSEESVTAGPLAPKWTWMRLVGLAWLAGVLLLSARVGLVAARLRRRARDWSEPDAPHLVALFERCRAIAGAGSFPFPFAFAPAVRLRVTGDDLGPAASGVWRPCVLIPRSVLESASPEELEHILLHELAHVRRWDVAVHWLMTAACVVHWFNPAVRLASARMQADRELACDAAVLRRIGRARRAAYGETVLKLAARFASPRPLPGLVGVFGSRGPLHERIAMIARDSSPGRGWGLASAGLLCLFAAAGLTDAAPPTPHEAPPPAAASKLTDAPKPPEPPPAASPARREKVTLSGTVRDADAKPLVGAKVRLFRVRQSLAGPDSVEEVATLTTPDDGSFRFADLPSPFRDRRAGELLDYALAVTRPGLSSSLLPIRPEQETEGLDVTLKPAAALRGRVTNSRGEPVAGAEVYLDGLGPGDRLVPGLRSTKTDEQGRYELPDLAAWNPKDVKSTDPKTGAVFTTVSQCFFRVRHPDYGLKLAGYKAIPAVVDVQLEPAAILEGRVLDAVNGVPAAGAMVMTQGVDHHGFQAVRADDDGRYRLTSLVADRYNVWARLPDRTVVALDSFPVAVGETKRAPDLELIEGGFIAGRVLDGATGRPVARLADGWEIKIGLHGPSRPLSGASVESVTVAEDGSYRIRVAPGKNFPYIMRPEVADRDAGTARRSPVIVREGETVALDIHLRPKGGAGGEIPDEGRDRPALRHPYEKPGPAESTPERIAERIASLRRRPADIRGPEPWVSIRDLVSIGRPAVPALIEELDRTTDEWPLRLLGFTLRAVGDPRAVPALIRAIPRTLVDAGSDFGLTTENPELFAFLKRHDLDEGEGGSYFGIGMPFREITGALHAITGRQFNEAELNFVSLQGGAESRRLQRQLFGRLAVRWAGWWEENGRNFTEDPAYLALHLPPLPEASRTPAAGSADSPFPTGPKVRATSGWANVILGPPQSLKYYSTFKDLDTGRDSPWPDGLPSPEEAKDDAVAAWGAREGYDLRGGEYRPAGSDRSFYALRGVGLRAWQVEDGRFDTIEGELRSGEPLKLGRPVGDLLVDADPEPGTNAPENVATFLFVTHEGTTGILQVTGLITELLRPSDFGKPSPAKVTRGFYRGVQFRYKLLYQED